ncbi:hypothetical protein ACFLU4_03965 [Chloroflexota bacterium]
MARYLDVRVVARLATLTRFPLAVQRFDDRQVPPRL